MTASASIHIDAGDITERPLLTDQGAHAPGCWSIRIVDQLGVVGGGVWLTGTVAELDEAHVRFGAHIVALRARIAEEAQQRAANVATAERAFGWEQAITQVGAV